MVDKKRSMRKFTDNDVHLAHHNLQFLPAILCNDIFRTNIPISLSSKVKRDIGTILWPSYLWDIWCPNIPICFILHNSNGSLGNGILRTLAPGHINIPLCSPVYNVRYFVCEQNRGSMPPRVLPIALLGGLLWLLYNCCPPLDFIFTSTSLYESTTFNDIHCCHEFYRHDYSVWFTIS